MRVYTAPDRYEYQNNDIKIFLAGGICKCDNWQQVVIEELEKEFKDRNDIVVFNPRRETFDMSDPNASYYQIKWEFDNLERMNFFTMFFCNGESDQPICMYELGRNLARFAQEKDFENYMVVSVCEGYKRKTDVVVQSALAGFTDVNIFGNDVIEAAKKHAEDIIEKVKKL